MQILSRGIFVSLLVGLISAPAVCTADDKFAVGITVSGAKPGVGQVLVSLFDSAENYMNVPLLETSADVDSDGKAFFALGERSPGEYAIVVIYDENGNGKLDTGLFRIPKEKVGYSNNARGRFGPAKWKDTRFTVTDSDINMTIQLADAKRGQ